MNKEEAQAKLTRRLRRLWEICEWNKAAIEKEYLRDLEIEAKQYETGRAEAEAEYRKDIEP